MSPRALLPALVAACLASTPATAAPPAMPAGVTRDVPFDDGWRFHRGDAPGADRPGFDDSAWRTLDLPHD